VRPVNHSLWLFSLTQLDLLSHIFCDHYLIINEPLNSDVVCRLQIAVNYLINMGAISLKTDHQYHVVESPSRIIHQAVKTTDRFPAHPYHHLLIDPDDDNQWLFGHHIARGGHGGLDLWLGGVG
jgi:hypothetical protein